MAGRIGSEDVVLAAHGGGGSLMRAIIDEVFLEAFGPQSGDDAFVSDAGAAPGRLALSTDTFVVTPRFFPGGDIGRLAVCGTVNDVATSGAEVRWLSCGFVLEEGLPIADLRRICASMAAAADEAGVAIVTGDTKVVEHGRCDGLYINTTGVGTFPAGRVPLSGAHCRPGDAILLSGTLGDHGTAIASARMDDGSGGGFGMVSGIESDAAPLNGLIADVLAAAPGVRCFRDPTRGGLASTLNELAAQSGVSMTVREADVPVDDRVRGCCDLLGFDVFQVANEGKMVCVVDAADVEAALTAMRAHRYGANAAIIGEVSAPEEGRGPRVYVETDFGSRRIMDMLVGEQLPRIC